jgi:hypothetical protein
LERLCIVALFLAALVLIHPAGNFPLDDDGMYGRPTFEFVRTGHIHMTAVPTAVRAQLIWGALFVRLFGESFNVLRAATIVSAVIALLMINALLRLTTIPRGGRIIATLALAFHPLFLWASCTFMTEVHFVCASAIAIYCYARGLREDRVGFLIAACIAVAVSWWIRQTGVFTAFAALAVVLFRRDGRWKRDATILAMPIAAFAFVAIFWRSTLMGSSAVFDSFLDVWRDPLFHVEDAVALVYRHTFLPLQQMSLWLLPIVAAAAIAVLRKFDWRIVAVAVVMSFGFMMSVSDHLPMPYYGRSGCCENVAGDIFMNFGLGPPTTYDVFTGQQVYPFTLPYDARIALTLLATLAAIVFVTALIRGARNDVVFLLSIAYCAAHIAGLSLTATYFDRYSLTTAWPLVIAGAMMAPWHRAAQVRALVVLAVIAVFGILAVNEYFSWQRARWTAYGELRRAGVSVTDIEGGMEAEFMLERPYITDVEYRRLRRKLKLGPKHYMIAFNGRERWHVIARHPFSGWLGMHQGVIYTLQKN